VVKEEMNLVKPFMEIPYTETYSITAAYQNASRRFPPPGTCSGNLPISRGTAEGNGSDRRT
jgi:hypothetical protein